MFDSKNQHFENVSDISGLLNKEKKIEYYCLYFALRNFITNNRVDIYN